MACKQAKNSTVLHKKDEGAPLMPTWDDYFSDGYFEDCPKNAHWRKRLCDAMLAFGVDEKSLFLIDFCKQFKIQRPHLYELAKKYPDIGKAYADMKVLINHNRYKAMAFRLITEVVKHDMHRYDPEWGEDNVVLAELTKKSEEQKQNITVIMQKPEVMDKE